jgi:uncharacterized protein (DUF1919 family)
MKWKDELAIDIQKRLLKNDSFSIISNDCWGAEVYRNFGIAYRTPFVGLFIMAPCYVTMLKNLKFFIEADLIFTKASKYEERNSDREAKNKFYPIGLLNGEVEIHFLHYSSEQEAFETWNKRKQRINWSDLYIKFDSAKDACTIELLQEFDSLPYVNKLCIGKQEFPSVKCAVGFDNWQTDGAKMYKVSLEKVNMISWLNGGDWHKTGFFYKTFYNLFIRNNDLLL